MTSPRRFFVADFNSRGELRATEEYHYEQLEKIPGAGELITHFSTLLWRSPEEFETTLPLARKMMNFRWRACADTAGIATLRSSRELISIGILAAGLNREADQITFQAFQHHLLRELHDTGIEPAFALMDLVERPIVASIQFQSPTEQTDQLLAALTDRCFAASYFRKLSLA